MRTVAIFLSVVLLILFAATAFCQNPGVKGYLCATFTNDGKKIIAGNSESRITIWSAETGKQLSTLSYPSHGKVSAIAISPDDNYLYATSFFDDCFFKIAIATGKVTAKYCNKNTSVSSIQLNAKGTLALTACSLTNMVYLWDLESAMIKKKYAGLKSGAGYASFSPDEKCVLSAAMGLTWKSFSTVRLWDATTGICLDSLDSRQQNLVARYSPNGRYIAVGGADSQLELFDANTKQLLQRFDASDKCFIYDAVFTLDSKNIICTAGDKLRVWNIETGKRIQELSTKHTNCIRSIALDASGHHLVSAAEDGKAFLWDARAWKVIRELQ